MLQQQESEFSFNKAALESIADCLVYFGKQGIALRDLIRGSLKVK